MKKFTFVFIMFITVSLLSQEDKPKITTEEYGKLMMEGIIRGRVSFYISGIVTDTQKNPLRNVLMTVEKTRTTGFDRSIDEEEKQTVNGKFHLRTNKQNSITFSLKKDGYYDVNNIYFSPRKHKNKVKNGVLEINDLKIVMRKIGKLVDLLNYEGTLKFTYDGKATVLSLKQKTDEDGNVIKHEKGDNYKEVIDSEELLKVKNIFKQDALPANCIYAIADSDKSGKIKTKLFNDDYYYKPTGIRLYFSAHDSGFLIYEPQDKPSVNLQMLKAPKKGYKKELIIDVGKYIKARKTGRNRFYFYFKANGKYGKGFVRYIKYFYKEDIHNKKKGNGELEVRVELSLNPDGTRNLESLD